MIVPDALADERFFDNPLVTGTPNIRFYAGTPLITEDGYALGTLCVIDTVARTMTTQQLQMLRMAGRIVIKLLEQRLTAKLLEAATAAQHIAEAALHAEIAQRMRVEDQLCLASSHDSLTALPNRAQFLSRLHTSLGRLRAGTGNKFGVCFIDLDHFKQINDTLGHVAGDALLTEVGRRLTKVKRSRDVVARLGGDEFAVFIDGLATTGALKSVAKRIASAVRPPLAIGKADTRITASTGIVFVDGSYSTVEDIIRDADIAMYASKERGRDRHTVFSADLREQFTLANEMKLTLRRALDQQEFRLGYQPIVSLTNPHARPIAFEALLRWEQRDGSHITAAQFIDTAEQTGMIVELGYWVMREACAQARRWEKSGGDPIVTTVNVSAKQLTEPGFVLAVKRIVREAKLNPTLLGIEVTESILIGDVESSLAIMNELREIGIKIYLDDFGTGYSSLSYLRKFPVDRIKIDRSFVSGIDDGLADPLIVASVIALAHKLNIRVVAEGVETERQRSALKELGCDYAQGYLFSRAVPAAEASLLLLIAQKHTA
jgi:diguanylate cyclase (GGDEF)-like protein